jgi:type I protein arginine methyltransferase
MGRINSARTIDFHHLLLAERCRTESYQKAITQTVHPGDVVLDVGTGTGILALFACRAGARRVYAIESGPVIELAREVCQRNCLQDQIVFLNDLSFNVSLPEQVDVLVTETGAACGFEGGTLGIVIDAKKRFLKKHGVVIPYSLDLVVAPVQSSKAYDVVDIWKKDLYGFDFSSIRSYALNNHYPVRLGVEALLSEPISVARVLLPEASDTFVQGVGSCTLRSGMLHGIVGWATTELMQGIGFSNSPASPTVDFRHRFFPLESPVVVNQDDRLSVDLSTIDGQKWRWKVELETISDGHQNRVQKKLKFDQSTFRGFPFSRPQLAKGMPEYKPKLSRRGQAELFILSRMNGKHAISELENELLHHFRDCFPTTAAASAFIGDVQTLFA